MPRVLAGWLPLSCPRLLNCCSDDQEEEIVAGLLFSHAYTAEWSILGFSW